VVAVFIMVSVAFFFVSVLSQPELAMVGSDDRFGK
jgi:hypothetical protein